MMNADFFSSIVSALGLIQYIYRFTSAQHEIETDHNIRDRTSTFLFHISKDLETRTGCLSNRRKQLIDADIKHLKLLLKDVKNAAGDRAVKGIVRRRLRDLEWVFKNKEAAQMSKDAALHDHLMLLTNMMLAVLESIRPCCGDTFTPELDTPLYLQLGRLGDTDGRLKKLGWSTGLTSLWSCCEIRFSIAN